MRRRFLALAALTLVSAAAAVPAAFADPNNNNSQKLRKAVTLEGIREHQAAFQSHATFGGGNRLAGLPGHDASAQYVYDKSAAAGYNVRFQEFTYLLNDDRTPPVLERITAPAVTFVNGVDFATMTFSGSGDVTAPVTAVDLLVPVPAPGASTSGCEAVDFAGFPAGNIALMQRGTCTFRDKVLNALAAGASAAIISNDGAPGRTGVLFGTLNPPPVLFPAAGTSFAVGENLRNGVLNGSTGITAHFKADRIFEEKTTRNVIAETTSGDPTNVVVVGAHLDSVAEGPGINDNGSGSGAILEVAEQMEKVKPRNKVRFIWFSAEESGLIGSQFYVNSLSQAERDNIALMLNFDMVGSPNFVRFVYDGDNSAFPVGPGVQEGPPGSGAIEKAFADYFAAQGLPNEPTPFSGRSDYGPFITNGIPAGGLFTGAEGIKTLAQASIYGGTAGIQYDPCYHLVCDTFSNVSLTALDQMSDAVAHVVITFAQNTSAVNGVKGKGNFKGQHVEFQASR